MQRVLSSFVLFGLVVWAPGSAQGAGMATKNIAVSDEGFSRVSLSLQQSDTLQFDFQSSNLAAHTVESFFFTSPSQAPGSSYAVVFFGCGKYTVTEDQPGVGPTMTVKVPTYVSPSEGTVTTRFLLTFAGLGEPACFGFSIQYQYPGSTGWTFITKFDEGNQYSFVPNHGPGTYEFRALTREVGVRDHAGWSKPVSISVTP